MYNILAIFGKSGVGKDTLLKAIEKEYLKDVHTIVSYTTRPPRDKEKDGINYHFINKMDFAMMKAEERFLETAAFNGWYYGTGIDDLNSEKINIGVFNPKGIQTLIELDYNKKINVCPILLESFDKIRLIRYLNREENPDIAEMIRRYEADEKDFEYFNKWVKKNYPLLFIKTINTNSDFVHNIAKEIMDEAIKYFNSKNDNKDAFL